LVEPRARIRTLAVAATFVSDAEEAVAFRG
jgi:hypothetical protein